MRIRLVVQPRVSPPLEREPPGGTLWRTRNSGGNRSSSCGASEPIHSLMEDYHAGAPMNGTGFRHRATNWIGAVALVAGLALSVGGVEFAQAESPQPAGSHAPSEAAICKADPAATATANVAATPRVAKATERSVERELAQALAKLRRQDPETAEELPMELNTRGYNYGAPVAMNRHGR